VMRKSYFLMWGFLVSTLTAGGTASAEGLFLDVPRAEQQKIIDRNFDAYHKSVFRAMPGRSRLIMLNSTLMDRGVADAEIKFFDDMTPIQIQSSGVTPIGRGTPYGQWIGILGQQETRRVANMSTGKSGREIRLKVKLQYWDVVTLRYVEAPGWFQVKKDYESPTQEGSIGPVPAGTEFRYSFIATDNYIYDPTNGWLHFKIQPLHSDPGYAVITMPDKDRISGVFEGDLSPIIEEKITRDQEDYARYRSIVDKEKSEREGLDR